MNGDERQRDPGTSSDAPTVPTPTVDEITSHANAPVTEPISRTDPLSASMSDTQIRRAPPIVAGPLPKRTVLDSSRRISRVGRKLRRAPPRGIRSVAIVLLILFIAALVGLIALNARPTWFAGLRNGPNPSNPVANRETTSSSVPAGNAGAPLISAIQPNSGTGGDTVSIIGSGIVSTNGSIVALFGSTVASTRCPNEQRCLVVVPPRSGGAKSIDVRLRTNAGLSNELQFHYR